MTLARLVDLSYAREHPLPKLYVLWVVNSLTLGFKMLSSLSVAKPDKQNKSFRSGGVQATCHSGMTIL